MSREQGRGPLHLAFRRHDAGPLADHLRLLRHSTESGVTAVGREVSSSTMPHAPGYPAALFCALGRSRVDEDSPSRNRVYDAGHSVRRSFPWRGAPCQKCRNEAAGGTSTRLPTRRCFSPVRRNERGAHLTSVEYAPPGISLSDGAVVWITGLAESGKTTVSERLVDQLVGEGIKPVHLDGNAVREAVG